MSALGDVGHYTFVSSISVYADLSTPPSEATPLAELKEPTEEWQEAYGELKALCEEAVLEQFPGAFIPRPGLIVGPWDPTGRFTYWPVRLAAGGRVLAPLPLDADTQVIDARDLAAWIVGAVEDGLGGTYNAVGPVTTRERVLETCRTAAGAVAELVWVDPDFLHGQGVEEWMELPLWLHDVKYGGMLSVDPTPASAAGLQVRPLEETTRDTLAWAQSSDAPNTFPAGLDREKERAVLDEWLSKE
jgi:2'-hydroxyisoflavone reductase